MWLFLAILELLAVLAAMVYVQFLVGSRTTRASHAWLVRGLLVAVGAAFGLVVAQTVPDRPDWWLFLTGFGVVHVPPAVVLFLKRQRRPG